MLSKAPAQLLIALVLLGARFVGAADADPPLDRYAGAAVESPVAALLAPCVAGATAPNEERLDQGVDASMDLQASESDLIACLPLPQAESHAVLSMGFHEHRILWSE